MASDLYTRIKVLIQKRHPGRSFGRGKPGQWVTLFELRDGTGTASFGQRMDAFAMCLWPSQGFHRVGYEIKLSRSDFLNELKAPQKRAWGMSITNEFWFVTPPNVASKEEMPEDCGLLHVVADGEKLRTARAARQRKPDSLTMTEVAALIRNALDQDVFSTMRWQFNGKELNHDDLTKLVDAESDKLRDRHVVEEIERIVEKRMKNTTDALKQHASELQKVGIEPPRWMLDGYKNSEPWFWDAQTWVRNNITSLTDLDLVKKAVQRLRNLEEGTHTAVEFLDQIIARAEGRKKKPRPVAF